MNILNIFEKSFFSNIYFVIDRDGFGSVTVVVCVNEKCLTDLWYHQRSHHDEIVRDNSNFERSLKTPVASATTK